MAAAGPAGRYPENTDGCSHAGASLDIQAWLLLPLHPGSWLWVATCFRVSDGLAGSHGAFSLQ